MLMLQQSDKPPPAGVILVTAVLANTIGLNVALDPETAKSDGQLWVNIFPMPEAVLKQFLLMQLPDI